MMAHRFTSVRELAAAADITESAIYRHFSGKEKILDAILDTFRERVYQPLPPLPEESAGTGFAHGLLVGLPRLLVHDPILLDCSRFLLGEMHHNAKIHDFIVASFIDQAQDLTASMIKEHYQDQGEL
jgi:AcrR family transcriptional regulator